MRPVYLFIVCIVLSGNFACGNQPGIEPVSTDSVPKTVEDSAHQIINRANKNLRDSGQQVEDSSSVRPKH